MVGQGTGGGLPGRARRRRGGGIDRAGDAGRRCGVDERQLVGFEQPGERDQRHVRVLVQDGDHRHDQDDHLPRVRRRFAGTPAIAKNFGIGAGTVARSGQTITYTVTSSSSISSGIPIYIEFSGLTNTSTAGSYTTKITTQTNVPATIDTPSRRGHLVANNTAVTVTVAKSLTFTIDTTAFELDWIRLPALADQTQTVGLTVQTNANSGYTLSVADNAAGLQSASTGNPTSPMCRPARPRR